MKEQYTPEQTHAFYFGLVAVIVFGAMFFAMAFSKHTYKHVDNHFYYLNASFGRTDGLLVGDKVRMAGVDIGRVVSSKLGLGYHALLTMEIKEGIKIPDDSSASIVSSGIMGNKYIEIEPGGSEDYLAPNAQFNYTQDAIVLEELLDRIVTMGKSKHQRKETSALEEEFENE